MTDPAKVTSPPYDVIGPDTVADLLAAEPHNVVRLILPGAAEAHGGGTVRASNGGAAHTAAATLRGWLASGVLVRDPRPALYVYEQRMPPGPGDADPGDGTQRGLIGAVRLMPPSARRILPHEDVMPGPVAGRRDLMEATGANLEPIFLLYDSGAATPGGDADARRPGDSAGGAATRLVAEIATSREPLLSAVTGDGVRHRLWAVTDRAEQAAIAADLATRSLLIADGHHRYAAYLDLQARRHAAGDGPGPWDYGLAFVVDAAAYPPRLSAIHRVLPGLRPAAAVDQAARAFRVREVHTGLDGALRELDIASRGGTAFLIAGDGRCHLLTEPSPAALAAALPPDRSARWRGLAPSILAELLVGHLWRLTDGEPDVVAAVGDAAAAVRSADRCGGTAVICPAVSVADVHAVAATGERMPRKSTSFGPKPRTGFVIRTFASDR